MKYSVDIVIDKPRDELISLFDDADNMKKWMRGLESFETIEGTPGQEGARAKMIFQMGKRRVEMIETILKRNFPHEFTGTYEAKGVYNKIINRFEEINESQTKYITEHEFRLKGFMRLFAWLMPGAFKKQSRQYLQDFKTFAENA